MIDVDEALVGRDGSTVWHSYAPMPAPVPVIGVERAQGVTSTLTDGRELTDAMSSWWAAIHGYRHPVLESEQHSMSGVAAT